MRRPAAGIAGEDPCNDRRRGDRSQRRDAAFKDYLFKTLGLPVLKTTAKNSEAADDQTMVMLAEWCAEHRPELVPLFELVQEYRKWSKLKTTYIDGYLRFINPVTGRIHPDLLPLVPRPGALPPEIPTCRTVPARRTTL